MWASAAALIASPAARAAAVAVCASAILVVTLKGPPSKKPPKSAPGKDGDGEASSSSSTQNQQHPLRSRSRTSFSSFSLSESKNSVAIFWDVDNCSPPTGASGHSVAQAIRRAAQSAAKEFTRSESNVSIVSFKAYLELTTEGVPTSAGKVQLHSELQGSGVSLIDTPKSGRKDVADKMMITDLLSFAIDKRPPALIVLLSGDRDFAYPLGILRNRGYEILLIVPPIGATPILEASANYVMRWRQDVLRLERDANGRLYDKSARELENNTGGRAVAATKETESSKAGIKGSSASAKTTQGSSAAVSVTTLKGPGAPPVPSIFHPLVSALEQMRKEGLNRPLRSQCAMRLLSQDAQVFKKAGATTWGDYAAVAEAAGIVTLGDGSKPGMEWIALRSIHDNATLKLKAAEKTAAERNAAGQGAVSTNGKKVEAITHAKAVEPSPVKPSEGAKKAEIPKEKERSSNIDDITLFYPLIEVYKAARADLPKGEYPTVAQVTAQVTKMWEVSMRDAYEKADVKTFAAYMELAEQAKIGRLVKLDTKPAVTIVHIHSKYVSMLSSPSSSETKLSQEASKTSILDPIVGPSAKKTKELKEVKEAKENGKTASSIEMTMPQKSNDKNPLLHAHLPSGEKIHVSYFPLCNVLLTQRAEGKATSSEAFLQGVLSKHNKISHFVSTPEQFASYLGRAERDNIVLCEGSKVGKRIVRLAPRLCVGEEEHNRQRREKYAAENSGAKEPSPTGVVTILQREKKEEKQDNEGLDDQQGEDVGIVVSPDFGSESATPQERVKFKPLVDVLVSLRRESPEENTEAALSRVSSTLVHHCAIDGKVVSPGAWIQSQGYSGFVEYYQSAQKKGFVHLIKSVDEKVVLRMRLAERYEAMFFHDS